MLKKLNNKKGFTLMEMLIVVVAIAIPVFNGALTKSKEAADVANIRAAYAEWQVRMLTENEAVPTDKTALAGYGIDQTAFFQVLIGFGYRIGIDAQFPGLHPHRRQRITRTDGACHNQPQDLLLELLINGRTAV